MISLDHVTKSFRMNDGNRNIVLDDISYTFRDGVSMGILGLNGAGKSTLFRIICGTDMPDSGTVKRTGRVSWPIGFSGGFHKSLTGRENMRFTCRIYGADINKVTRFVEDFAELGQYMDMPMSSYSSGMKSRLTFGLSMAIGFDFYLIDEGFAVGDATFRARAQQIFAERRKNATLLVIGHSTSIIKANCDNAAILKDGHLIRFNGLDEALATYKEICHGV